ncbi:MULTISPECIES: hypothetical protein [Streptomyces]|uniref:hypothetical protein n=1 Tax=Streptomyces TaxID=1883 RepID=UPI00201FFC45|nr:MULTISPECIES: hypothetical protein [Streptomyces]MCL7497589.1 hypothetical protein [Streptomyces sp. MCA2]
MHEQGKAAMWCGLLLFTAPAAGAATPQTSGPPTAGHGRYDARSATARPAAAPRAVAAPSTAARGPWPISAPPRH